MMSSIRGNFRWLEEKKQDSDWSARFEFSSRRKNKQKVKNAIFLVGHDVSPSEGSSSVEYKFCGPIDNEMVNR